jgi:FKBP-type peptidyl-prolyl cis-trans isomerase 2
MNPMNLQWMSRWTLLLLISVIFWSCNQSETFKRSPEGLEYRFVKQEEIGKTGKVGDIYLVNLQALREDDSVFLDTREMGNKLKFQRGKSAYPGDFQEALSYLKVGDSAVFRLRADSFYVQTFSLPVPPYLRSDEYIRMYIGLKDILSPIEHTVKMYQYELEEMESYLAENKWTYRTDTASGIKYEVLKGGTGKVYGDGEEVNYKYLMKLTDGKMVVRTNPDSYVTTVVNDGTHIEGLDHLFRMMKPGGKVRALIPFSLAFGDEGNAVVPAYSTIVVELETVPTDKTE